MLIAPCTLVLGGLHWIMLVVNRRGRTGEIVDLVDLHIERKRNVVPHQVEVLVIEEMLDVASRAGEKVVRAENVGAKLDQALTEMRANKSSSPRHQHTCFEMH
jgi:hypothetical protein